jgi:hypothetical protein
MSEDDELLSAYSVAYAQTDAPSERHTAGIKAVESLVRKRLAASMPNLVMLSFSDDLNLDYSFAEIKERVTEIAQAAWGASDE